AYVHWFLRTDERFPSFDLDVAVVTEWVTVLSLSAAALSAVALLLAVAWTSRAYRNLAALGVDGLRFSPDIVGAAWIVPGVNLLVPKLVLDELWRGSDPASPAGSR